MDLSSTLGVELGLVRDEKSMNHGEGDVKGDS